MFPKVDKPKAQIRPNDYTLHVVGVNLLNATILDKVEMMEEMSKAMSLYFIKKSHCLEKMQAKNVSLTESLDKQRKEDRARNVEINLLQGLLTQANSEKGKL